MFDTVTNPLRDGVRVLVNVAVLPVPDAAVIATELIDGGRLLAKQDVVPQLGWCPPVLDPGPLVPPAIAWNTSSTAPPPLVPSMGFMVLPVT